MTWLVVEDDPDIRNIITILFQAWGHEALDFADGNKAFTWLDSIDDGTFTDEIPELALLDIRMPGPTGDKIAERIRRTKGMENIAIVMMTAFSLTDEDRERLMATTQADKFINKPLPDMDVLSIELHHLVEEKKSGQSE